MKKYVCSICGYVYDEEVGDPERGVAPGAKWGDVPGNWVCPLCGAGKSEFSEQQLGDDTAEEIQLEHEDDFREMRELSFGELSALCSNLSKGCEKQYLTEEAELFERLSEYYGEKTEDVSEKGFDDLIAMIQQDLGSGYPRANKIAAGKGDRGALRALVWGEKVTRMLNSLLSRYEKEKGELLKNTNVYVCEICGFTYVGDEAPAICPICKVPSIKIKQIQRGE